MSGTPNDRDALNAATSIRADRIPETVRSRIRNQLPADVARQFDELLAWEDDIVRALNLASEAADRMADGLERIEENATSWHGDDAAKARALAVIAQTAREARSV